MTVAGAAVLPSAPLLVPGVSATLPDGVGAVCDAVDVVVERLPEHRSVVLVAAAERWGVYGTADAGLSSIGRPDVARKGSLDRELVDRVAGDLDWPILDEPLPLDLSVLALLLGNPPPLVALGVPAAEAFDVLAEAGRRVAGVLRAVDGPVVVVSAGDLSAGLAEGSPLHAVEGAREFDACVIDAVDAGRLDALARLGPGRAREVGARGWAPLSVLHGVLEHTKLGLVRRVYAAPRGVGYLVAYGS